MENNFENTPEEKKTTYADPNADAVVEEPDAGEQTGTDSQSYQYSYNSGSNQGSNAQNYSYSYDQNVEYNTRSNTSYAQNYDTGLDTSPLSFGDWILTLLVQLIPCGFLIYSYWACARNGNLNRRNFCRAYLIIMVVTSIIGIILALVCCTVIIGSLSVGHY